MHAERASVGAGMVACALFALLTARAAAQQPSPSPAVPRFEGAARLVTVDVVVTDAAGRPVRSLSADEFRVSEDGRPRPLARFDPPPETQAPLPGTAPAIGPRHASILLVIDDEHLTPAEARQARPLLEHLLCSGLAKQDRATLVVVSSAEWWSAIGDAACAGLGARLRALRGRLINPHDDDLSGPG